jgi:hypothetical protein
MIQPEVSVPDDQAIELSDLIWQLRGELIRAMWGGQHKELRFRAETIELELAIGVERQAGSHVEAKFWVLGMGANADRKATRVQTLRLTLKPVHADAPDQPALIDGAGLPGE